MKQNKIFKTFTAPHKKFKIWGVVFVVLSVVMMLLLAQITQLFIDTVYSSSGTTNANFGIIWSYFIAHFGAPEIGTLVLILSIAFVLVAMLKSACTFGANQCFFTHASRARSALRKSCFKKLSFTDFAPAPQKTFFNLTSDITDFAEAIYSHKPKMIENAARVILAMILCFFIQPQIALAMFVFLPAILIVGFALKKKLVSLFSEARSRKSDMFGKSEEMIKNIREIKIFGSENWATKKYGALNQSHTNAVIKSQSAINHRKIWLNLLRVGGIATAVGLGAYACFNGLITVGYFVLIMAYAIIIFDAAVNFMYALYDHRAASVSARRLGQFLDAPSSIKINAATLAPKFDIEFQNVGLNMGKQRVFGGLNFTIPYGTHTMILIENDQAKQALAKMFLRLVPNTSGTILYHQNPCQIYDISSLRKGFSYVAQEPAIFEGTILDNITMFEKPNMKKFAHAIELCDLQNLVESFGDKENHFLAESGKNLPAQTRQKIALARAVYRGAPVLLLDNAFNKFSAREGKALLKKLKEIYAHKTIIFLAEDDSLKAMFEHIVEIGGDK